MHDKITNFIFDHPKLTDNIFRALKVVPDRMYIDILYKHLLKKKVNWNNPKDYTEKIQWLKLYNKDERLIKLADKYEVRNFIKEKGYEEILVPLYGVYDDVEKIDLSTLPNKFILKANHGSGFNLIVKDKNKIDWQKQKKIIKAWLDTDYSLRVREWAYHHIKPMITIEEFLEDPNHFEIMDYKFYTFNGEVKFLILDSNVADYVNTKRNVFDRDFKEIKDLFIGDYRPNENFEFIKPKNFEKMIEIAESLSKDFVHVRVDFYNIDGKIYFGEMTFYPHFGMDNIQPPQANRMMGNWIDLNKVKPH